MLNLKAFQSMFVKYWTMSHPLQRVICERLRYKPEKTYESRKSIWLEKASSDILQLEMGYNLKPGICSINSVV